VTKPKQCYIPNTELVSDKEGANFCDEFEFVDGAAREEGTENREKGKDAFNALFNDEGGEESKRPSLDDFKGLFGE